MIAYMWKCDNCGLVNHSLTWDDKLTLKEGEIHKDDWGVLGCTSGHVVPVEIKELEDKMIKKIVCKNNNTPESKAKLAEYYKKHGISKFSIIKKTKWLKDKLDIQYIAFCDKNVTKRAELNALERMLLVDL